MNCDRIVIALRSVCDVFHLAAFPNRPASERFARFSSNTSIRRLRLSEKNILSSFTVKSP
jgi:hypothetical protein